MNDYDYGIDFIIRNKDALLKMCSGPNEAYVVEQTIAALSAPVDCVGDNASIGAAFLSVLRDPQVAWRNSGAKPFIDRVAALAAAPAVSVPIDNGVLDRPARVDGRDFMAGELRQRVIGRAHASYDRHHNTRPINDAEREMLRAGIANGTLSIQGADTEATNEPHWKVGEFRSSWDEGRIVLVLSIGAEIDSNEKHRSFVRWVYSHPATPPQPVAYVSEHTLRRVARNTGVTGTFGITERLATNPSDYQPIALYRCSLEAETRDALAILKEIRKAEEAESGAASVCDDAEVLWQQARIIALRNRLSALPQQVTE